MAFTNKKIKRLIIAICLLVFSLVAGVIAGVEITLLTTPRVYESDYDQLRDILDQKWYSDIYYGKEIDENVLIDQFVGALSTDESKLLDPYTYLEKNVTGIATQVKGKLGITLTNYYNYPVVTDILSQGACYGVLQEGDIIYSIKDDDGKVFSIKKGDYSYSSLFSTALGLPGEEVTLYYYRFNPLNGRLESSEATVTLKEPTSFVKYAKEIDCGIDNTIMVSLSNFVEGPNGTYEQFATILANDRDSRNLIIDLIDNPGGSLSCVVNICGLLLPNNTLVTSLQDKYNNKTPYYTQNNGIYHEYDTITIYQNDGTASASEILISALTYYYPDKVTLVGSKSYGKGIASTSSSVLDGKYTLHYTVAKWLRPDDSWIGMTDSKYTTKEGYQLGFDVENKFVVNRTPINYYYLLYNGYLYYKEETGYNAFTIDQVSTCNIVFFQNYNLMFNTSIRTDGYFDNSCLTAVSNYQQSKGLIANGIMDELTYIYFVYDIYQEDRSFINSHILLTEGIING